jgi:hypothetical protein
MSFFGAALLLAWLAIALLAFALAGVMRQVLVLGRLQPDGSRAVPGVPRPAPAALSADAETCVLLAEAGCRTCDAVVPEFARIGAGAVHGRRHVLLVSSLPEDWARYQGPLEVVVDPGLMEEFDVPALPFLYSIREGQIVRQGAIGNGEMLVQALSAADHEHQT